MIFLSYKREDEARVARLARALESAGFSLWWDRQLPAGEDWRSEIEQALDSAKVVVVCWTRLSVGPDGSFVRDEAARAGKRILPVFLEKVQAPLGFGSVQGIDLSHWKGNAKDHFFRDLVEAIQARLDERPAPKPRGPASRAMTRWVFGGGATSALLAATWFLWSVPAVPNSLCRLPIAQPGLRGACCDAGLVDKSLVRDEAWSAETSTRLGYLRQSAEAFEERSVAEADARIRVDSDATQQCQSIDEFQRLVSSNVQQIQFQCRESGSGWLCGADYVVQCELEERRLVERCQ